MYTSVTYKIRWRLHRPLEAKIQVIDASLASGYPHQIFTAVNGGSSLLTVEDEIYG